GLGAGPWLRQPIASAAASTSIRPRIAVTSGLVAPKMHPPLHSIQRRRSADLTRSAALGRGDPMSSNATQTPHDPYAERLFKARVIIISGGIDQELAERVTAQLLAMSAESKDPITVYLNS